MKENIQHLRQVFDIYKQNNISIKSFETFIGYLSVQLLGQKVDLLNLATIKEKLAAIAKLKFSNTFYELETYLSFTEWLQDYVEYYAKISEPLKLRKTILLKGAPVVSTPK